MEDRDLKYLKTLSKQYPTIAAAATEIINLQAILSLPKGTEHFITDIHGEYEQFQHILKNIWGLKPLVGNMILNPVMPLPSRKPWRNTQN